MTGGSWKRYLIALFVNIGFTLLTLCARGFHLMIYYVDAFSVAGSVSILLGLLAWVVKAGVFDTIGYGFSTLRSDRIYRDYNQYISQKNEKRSRKAGVTLPFLVTGLVFLGISFLLTVF